MYRIFNAQPLAAHCVLKMDSRWNLTSVKIGEWDTTVDPDCDSHGCADPVEDNRIVLPFIVHPEYSKDSRHQHNDIALLRLTKRVRFNEFRKPICISLDSTVNERDYDGFSFDVAGNFGIELTG